MIDGSEYLPVTKEIAAAHEAGHAVMLVLLDRELASVRIYQDGEHFRGEALPLVSALGPSTNDYAVYLEQVRGEVKVCMAGEIAESALTGDPLSAHCHAAADYMRARDWLAHMGYRDANAEWELEEQRKQAEILLRSPANARAVAQLAEALCVRLTLSGQEAKEIVRLAQASLS